MFQKKLYSGLKLTNVVLILSLLFFSIDHVSAAGRDTCAFQSVKTVNLNINVLQLFYGQSNLEFTYEMPFARRASCMISSRIQYAHSSTKKWGLVPSVNFRCYMDLFSRSLKDKNTSKNALEFASLKLDHQYTFNTSNGTDQFTRFLIYAGFRRNLFKSLYMEIEAGHSFFEKQWGGGNQSKLDGLFFTLEDDVRVLLIYNF